MASAPLTAEQYLTPVRDLWYAVQYPALQSNISLPDLESLLLTNVPYLRNPISPFGAPSAGSKAQVEKGRVKVKTVTSKGKTSELEFDLNDTDKSFALEFSERLGIDEVESAILYLRFKRDEAGILEDMAATAAATALQSSVLSKSAKTKPTRTQNVDTMRLFTQYYHQEVLKICDLLSAVIRTASLNTEEIDDVLVLDVGEEGELDVDARQAKLKGIAQNVLDQVVGDIPSTFVQTMFMNFAKAAQTPATMKYGKDNAKEWALHYLKLQTALLEALFIYVFWNSTTVVKADLSVGLIQGVLGSAFGAHQLNQRLLDMLPRADTEFYFDKIQGLLGLIGIEASGASSLQNGSIQLAELTSETIDATDQAELHLLQSRDHIIQLHQSLGGASQDCTAREPFPLLLLAWASVLSQLPDYLQPEDQSMQDVPTFQKVATAALSPEMNVFERWSRMQSGALLRRPEYGAKDEDDSMSYKETFHALLMALSSLVRASYVKDLDELLEVWATLFGKGSSNSTAPLCNLFWENAADHASKGEILEAVNFPLYPLQSVKLLASLAGMGSQMIPDDSWNPEEAEKAAQHSSKWLTGVGFLTLVLPEPEDIDDNFKRVQEDNGSYTRTNVNDIELPGGLTIPRGSRGTELNRVNDKPIIIKWQASLNGWHVLLSLLREAAGLNPPSKYSWSDYGISVPSDELLSRGLSFISRLVVANPAVGHDLMALSEESTKDVLDIAFWVISNRQITSSRDPIHVSALNSALNLATSYVKIKSARVWSGMQQVGFFSASAQGIKLSPAQAIVEKETKAGDYSSTLCILRLIHAMTEDTINGQFEAEYRYVHAKSEFLSAICQFLHQSVWTRFPSWRYSHLTHRAEIGAILCDIYDKIASGPTFLTSLTSEGNMHPLMAINTLLIDKLIVNPSPFDFDPLFQILTQPKRLLDSLYRHSRQAEIFATEKTLLRGLQLASSLVRSAGQVYRSGAGLPAALSIIYNPAVATSDIKEHYHLVNILFDYVFSPGFQVTTATAAASLLNRLAAVQSTEDGSLSLLPCLQEPRRVGREMQTVLRAQRRASELRRELWTLLVTASQYQTGFASLCLDPRSIFIFGPGATTKDDEHVSQTILADVMDVIVNRNTYWDSDPTPLLSAMRILEIVYTEHPQIAAVGECATKAALWDAVYQLATSAQPNAPLINVQMLHDDEDRAVLVKEVVRYSSRRRIRASSVRILAAILERIEPSANSEEKDVADKVALKLLGEIEDYRTIVAEAGQNSCQPLAMSDSLAATQSRLRHCNVQQLTNPTYQDSSPFGENYAFNLKSITSVILDPEVEASVSTQLSAINLYWSEMQADTSFTAAVNSYTNNAIAFAVKPTVALSSAKAVQSIILESSIEDRAGDFMLAVQMERYQIIESLLQTVWRGEGPSESTWLVECVDALSVLCDHPVFSPALIAQSTNTYLQTAILDSCVYLLSIAHSSASWEDHKTLSRLRPALRRIGAFVAEITSDAMLTLTSNASPLQLENIEKANTIYDMYASTPRLFEILVHILDEHGIVKRSCEIISQLDLAGDHSSQHAVIYRVLLELHRVLAQDATGAGRLSAAGAIPTYSTSSLTEMVSSQRSGSPDASDLNGLWASMLSNMALVLRKLPYIATVVTEEVIPFINRANARVRAATEWELHGEVSLEGLREVVAMLEILQHIVSVVADDAEIKMSLLHEYASPLLRLLRAITNAINKPNLIQTYLEHIYDGEKHLPASTLGSVIDNQAASIMHSLIVAADSIVIVLRDLTYALQVLKRSQDANLLAPSCVLSSLSIDVSAVRILLDLDSALQDIELPPTKPASLAKGEPIQVIGLPLLPDDIVQENITRTREYGLIVTVVQAVTRHERDVAEEHLEKVETERKKADRSSDSLSALAEEKMIKAGRRRARQDLRDVNERIRRTSSSERSQVAQICGDFLHERCGADLSTW